MHRQLQQNLQYIDNSHHNVHFSQDQEQTTSYGAITDADTIKDDISEQGGHDDDNDDGGDDNDDNDNDGPDNSMIIRWFRLHFRFDKAREMIEGYKKNEQVLKNFAEESRVKYVPFGKGKKWRREKGEGRREKGKS